MVSDEPRAWNTLVVSSPLKPGIAGEYRVDVVSRREHPQHMLDREMAATNDRLAAKKFGG